MFKKVKLFPSICAVLIGGAFLTFTSCDDDDDPITKRTFHVTIENVSTTTTLQPGAMPDRTAPVSPGAWAVIESGTVFDLNQEANQAIENLAEEGDPDLLAADFALDNDIAENGKFSSPGGPDNGPALAPGESVTITFDADAGDSFQFLSMFGQSNDWFYAFGDGGLDLFNGNTAVDGDVTSRIVLYDAGTELDEMPGLGSTQKPDHPTTTNVGPADPTDMITNAVSRHSTFIIPPTSGVIRVTVTSED